VEIDFSEVLHGFGPELLEAIDELLCQIFVSHQKRSKTLLRDEGMVQTQDNRVVIHDMERMAQLSGITDPGHLFQMSPVLAEKSHQLWSCLISETKYDALVQVSFGGISRDAPENRKAAACDLFNCAQIAVLKVRQDSSLGGRQIDDVSFHVAFDATANSE